MAAETFAGFAVGQGGDMVVGVGAGAVACYVVVVMVVEEEEEDRRGRVG